MLPPRSIYGPVDQELSNQCCHEAPTKVVSQSQFIHETINIDIICWRPTDNWHARKPMVGDF